MKNKNKTKKTTPPQDIKHNKTQTGGIISVVRSSASLQKSPFLLPALQTPHLLVAYKPLIKPSWTSCRSSSDAPPQGTHFQLECQLWHPHFFPPFRGWGHGGLRARLRWRRRAGRRTLMGTSTWGRREQNCLWLLWAWWRQRILYHIQSQCSLETSSSADRPFHDHEQRMNTSNSGMGLDTSVSFMDHVGTNRRNIQL